jgi:alkylation response protein AidB-like acyl-CoA dehydrogenase
MTAAPPRDFGFGEDEQLLRDLARRFLDEHMPVERLRALVAADPDAAYHRGERPSWDEGIWKQIGELGWAGLAVPEAAGGVGGKMVGIAALVEEVGRHGLPSPLVATLCAAFALRAARSPEADAWLARIADGAAAALAITDARGSWDPGDCGVTGVASGAGIELSGAAHFVQDAFKADVLIVSARRGGHDGTLSLCAVPTDAAGVTLSQDHIHDLTRDQATAHFEGVRVARENVLSLDGAAALRDAWPAILVAVSADLCGTSEWQLQATVEYAKQRKQFERQIGFFQAVKHPLVNAMIEIDRARSLLYHAACCIDTGDGAEVAARMAKSAASDAGAFIADRSVQLHGGIGFTWECDVHLFFKRSMHNQMLYGDGAYQRKMLAEELIGPIGS